MTSGRIVLALTLFVMLFASIAFATTAYIRPPYLSYEVEIESGVDTAYPGTIEVKNLNSFDVTVVFTSSEWIEIIDSIDLEPGELQEVDFEMVINKSGTYSGDINAAYSAPGKFTASASSSVTLTAYQEGTQPTTTTSTTTITTSTTTSTTTSMPTVTTTQPASATTTTTTVPPAEATTTTTILNPLLTTTTTLRSIEESTTTIPEDPITIEVVRGPSSAEISAIVIITIITAAGAFFILRR